MVFPNPTENMVFVKAADVRTIEVIDPQGNMQRVMEGECEIDLSTMPKGVYFLRIRTDYAIVTKKVWLK